ncbi:hypothetical protein LMG23992_02112 [Cupriavidus laharis]|uniref:DNA-binding protein n=1 Tax=Cupriavidus laharis TaxID=151654 RepID=A0ABM8WX41_9BURK|nr:helix-turn-helix domain-containing protein [Cupriavidus laharis]CAG9172074.1 hypothetical protein LMG23992_02112 [Cupriavidus laharis]
MNTETQIGLRPNATQDPVSAERASLAVAGYTPGAMTINEFCERYRISRPHLLRMRQAGNGPDEIRIGRRVLITNRAAIEWERRIEAQSAGNR